MKKGTYHRFKDYLYFDYQYYLIPRKVLNSNISNNSKLLFVVLHKFRNKKVLNGTLAEVAGISESQISKSLKELENNGFITREGRGYNRLITPYEDFKKIQAKGDYVRIPAFIVEHKELTTNHKVLYFILLDIYFYYINEEIEIIKKVTDLYTEPKSRKNLSDRLACSEDRTSELIRDLAEKFNFEKKYLVSTDKAKYYSKYNLYKCNLITPTTKEGFEKLKSDLGVIDNKPDKEEFNIADELLIEDTPTIAPVEEIEEVKEEKTRVVVDEKGNKYKLNFYDLSEEAQEVLGDDFYNFDYIKLFNGFKSRLEDLDYCKID